MSEPSRQTLPSRIERLPELASDLWWSWNPVAREVFRRLDYKLWRQTNHNPVKMLGLVSPQRLAEVERDPSFVHVYDDAMERLADARSGSGTWWSRCQTNLSGTRGVISTKQSPPKGGRWSRTIAFASKRHPSNAHGHRPASLVLFWFL